jgi:hypothetical protein
VAGVNRSSSVLIAALAALVLLVCPALANAAPKISVDDTSAGEAPGSTAVFTVSLSKKAKKKVKAHFETSPGTAGTGDYSHTSGTLKIKKKKKRAKVKVPIVPDSIDEPDETFTLTLSKPKRAKLGDETGTGTIVDDDPPVTPPADADGDGVPDASDNCVDLANPAQGDADDDGQGDACDPCPDDAGACDPADADSDGIPNAEDNCIDIANPAQEDTDADGKGDVCDACPDVSNPGSEECPVPPTLTAIVEGSSCFETGQTNVPVATVHLSAPASSGGTQVGVTSDDPSVLTVDPVVTVPEGMTTALVNGSALIPGTATLEATLDGATQTTGPITVAAPAGCP